MTAKQKPETITVGVGPTKEVGGGTVLVHRPEVLPAEPLAEIPKLGPVGRFLAADRRSRSRDSYLKALRRAVRLLGFEGDPQDYPWPLVTVEVAVVLEAAMRKAGHAKRTRNQVRAAVRGVLKQCRRMKLLDAETYAELVEDHLQAEKTDPLLFNLPSDEDLEKLHAVCRKAGAVGLRDLVIFTLLTVARRSEVAALDHGGVNLRTGEVTVRNGKGGRTLPTAIHPTGLPLLREWIKFRGKKAGPFVGRFTFKRNGPGAVRYVGDRLSPQSVYDRCRQRCDEAGIELIRPHDWRRYYGSKHSENGTNPRHLQRLMRHADPATTASYDHSAFRAALKAAANFRLPWEPKAESQD